MKWYSLLLGVLLIIESCTNGSSSSSKEQEDSTKVVYCQLRVYISRTSAK